jgi:hypothetical protein
MMTLPVGSSVNGAFLELLFAALLTVLDAIATVATLVVVVALFRDVICRDR